MPQFAHDPEAYEHRVVAAMAADPDVAEAFHWPDAPERALLDSGYLVDVGAHRRERLRNGGYRDYGLDCLCRTRAGAYVGVQAKAYGAGSTVTASGLGTFRLAVDFLRDRDPRSSGVLFHTPETALESRLRIALDRGIGGIRRRVLPAEGSGGEGGQATGSPPAPGSGRTPECQSELTPRQARAAADILEDVTKEGVGGAARPGLYVAPCGTGKTVVVGAVLRDLAPAVAVVASPLQASAQQNADRLSAFLPGHALVRAWTQAGATTPEVVAAKVLPTAASDAPGLLVCTTFDTLPVVAAALRGAGRAFFLAVDEAHNLPPAAAPPQQHQPPLWDAVGAADRAVLVTATPPAPLFATARLLHAYAFHEAIRDGALCDYRIFVPEIVSRGGAEEEEEEEDGDDDDGDDCDDDGEGSGHADGAAAKAAFLAAGMLQHGFRRCVAFCESRATCALLQSAFRETCETFLGVGCATASVTCDTAPEDRERALREFRTGAVHESRGGGGGGGRKCRSVLRLLVSVRILDEAVDLPECDAVFFSRVTRGAGGPLAPARAVQRLCRAVRLHPGKRCAGVFVWTAGRDGEGGGDSGMLQMFSLLRESDPDFAGKVATVARRYDAQGTPEAAALERETVEEFHRRFTARAVDPEQRWRERLAELTEYVRANGRLPPGSQGPLGTWLNKRRQDFRKKLLSPERVEALEAVPEWTWGADDTFGQRVAEVTEYVRANGHLPPSNQSALGRWVSHRRKDFCKKVLSPERVEALEAVPEWTWGADDTFGQRVAEVTEYVRANGHLPPKRKGCPLGEWVMRMRHEFRKKNLSPERAAALEATPGWTWAAEDTFPQRVAEVTEYVRANGRLPPQSQGPLGTWVISRRQDFHKKVISPERVAALEAVPGWTWAADDTFPKLLAELNEYVRANGRLPPQSHGPLGRWVSNRRTQFRKKVISPERVAALEAVPGWTWGAEDTFPQRVAELTEYVRANGHLPPKSQGPLGTWVSNRRTQFHKKVLSPERVAALEAVPGWTWGQRRGGVGAGALAVKNAQNCA